MAPAATVMAEVLFPAMAQLLARDSTSVAQHDGKTEAQWETEGRYPYAPSFAAAIVFLVLYIIVLAVDVFQLIWYRSWFGWPMILAVTSLSLLSILSFSLC